MQSFCLRHWTHPMIPRTGFACSNACFGNQVGGTQGAGISVEIEPGISRVQDESLSHCAMGAGVSPWRTSDRNLAKSSPTSLRILLKNLFKKVSTLCKSSRHYYFSVTIYTHIVLKNWYATKFEQCHQFLVCLVH